MNKKSGHAVRIVLGGYLAYLGVRILTETIQKRPSNMTLMSVMAVIFIVVGIGYAGNAICKVFDVDIKKILTKMQEKKEQAKKIKAETNDIKDAAEKEKVSGETLPTMLSEEERKKLEEAAREKEMPDQEKKINTENPAGEKKEETAGTGEPVSENPEKAADAEVTEKEETETKTAETETAGAEDTAEKELGLKDTRVVDFFAEMDETPISEDAENDFEEK